MAYILRLGDRKYSRRFHTDSVYLNVDFTRNWTQVLPADVPQQLNQTFTDIIQDIGNYLNCQADDQVRVSVAHPGLKSPAWIPFRKWATLTASDILNPVARILQSNEQFRLDERMSLHVCHVRVPQGDGRGRGHLKRRDSLSLEDYLKRKKAIVVIKNKDDLCFQRAIVIAKHYANKTNTPEWEAERTRLVKSSGPYSWQTKKVHHLIQEVGAKAEACRGQETWEQYQKTLGTQGYQLFVYSKLLFGKLMYKGKVSGANPKKLHLYNHDHHYDVITSMPAFLERSYYCELCNKGYNNLGDHICISVCSACRRPGPNCASDIERSCVVCHRTFYNEDCLKTHLATICRKWKKCTKCCKEWDTSRQGRLLEQHICGEFKCKICNQWHMKGDQWCYIQKVAVDKENTEKQQEKDVTRFVFYDFECHQDTGEHIPNLCVIQLCCHFCIDSNGHCHHCDPSWNHQREVIIEGPNTLDEVAKFFIHLAVKKTVSGGQKIHGNNIVAVAHNFRGYDGLLILQGLLKHTMEPPQVILSGGKVMTIQLGCLKFVDSLNFLAMPLKDMPKTFGMTELKKGYFPHFFNRPENANYIGAYPPITDYDPDGMSVGEREKFLSWYQQQQTKTFHFEQELISYCQSDVDILRRCCGAFRNIFLTETGIDPFLDSLTIASACNKVYRAHYMPADTIVIVPRALMQAPEPGEDWKQFQPRQQSNKALRWLEWRQHENTIQAFRNKQPISHIKHARNGGEVKIGPYSLDGYDNNNKAYEFNGCCYHGCPTCYPGPFEDIKHYHPYDQSRNMRDLYQHTQQRLEKLKTIGIDNIEVIWECDFDRQRRGNPEMDQFITGLERSGWPSPDPLMPRDAFFGGRTNAIQLMAEPTLPGEKIYYIDVVSLYPYICKYGKFPIQEPDIITQPDQVNWQQYEGLIQCLVLPPKSLYHPVLPFRNQKLTFPLCRSCVQEKMKQDQYTEYELCQHTDQDRAWVGTFVSLELKKAVSLGYKVLKVFEVWHWSKWSQYDTQTKTGGLFANYIDQYLKMKMESSGYPENCHTDEQKQLFIQEVFEKEGVKLEPINITPNKGKRAFSKTILNVLWGKFGQRDNFSQTEYLSDPSEYFQLMNDASENVKDVQIVNDNMVMIEKVKKEQHVQPCAITNVVIAAFVTAQARLKLYSVLEPLGDRVCYFDTDSIIYKHRPHQWNPSEGSSLGEWKNELPENVHITQFVAGGPKNYAYKLSNGETVCKVRGFTLNYRGSQQLNYDTVKNMVRNLEDVSVAITNPHKIVRSHDRKLSTRPESKLYKAVYTKRMVSVNEKGEPIDTYPYGFIRC